jgi:putative ATP-dependent endonuclease of OLD family
MYLSHLAIENFRCFGQGPEGLQLSFRPGLTALVGENDAGKSAVIDALRFALGTTDQEAYRLDLADFNSAAAVKEIKITCKFEALGTKDQRAFLEYLSYDVGQQNKPVLYIHWFAKDIGPASPRKSGFRIECHSGKEGDGPSLTPEARELLQTTYLRPLRDAERVLAAGRGSRLSQVLHNREDVRSGGKPNDPSVAVDLDNLNVLGIGDLANALLAKQKGITGTKDKIDAHLKTLSLSSDPMRSSIKVSGTRASDDIRLRLLLEKLELILDGSGRLGLGSNNLLFMACELLLLAQEEEGNKLLLIEEPEAHLHAQRQLRVMKALQDQAKEQGIQVIVTTHSPNLASAIALENLVMIRSKRSFSLAEGQTELAASDYRFLQRFLDVTKANLFFSSGVMIVEGDAENILIPIIASLIDRDFTQKGVSVVNVGGTGLRRYARIFKRKDPSKDGILAIPVACLADMDVMPDCAPLILGKVKEGAAWPDLGKRRWRAKGDIGGDAALAATRKSIEAKASGQSVKTFVADEWTLEYSLSLGPKDNLGTFVAALAEDVYIAAVLADNDDAITVGKKGIKDIEEAALNDFTELKKTSAPTAGCTAEEVLAVRVYAKFAVDDVSKAVAAQYLGERFKAKCAAGDLTAEKLRASLPRYIVEAIDYVTGLLPQPQAVEK